MKKGNNGTATQRKSANASKIYDPTQLDTSTGETKEVIFKMLNPNNQYMKGSFATVDPRFRRPTAFVPAVCRVRYYFSEDEREEASKDGRTLPESTVLTAYYNKGTAGYVEDLDHVSDPEKFYAECDQILFASSPEYDATLTPVRVVQPEEKELLWYLRMCSFNDGSLNKHTEHRPLFYEYNPIEIAADNLRKDKMATKAQYNFMSGIESDDSAVRDAVWTQHLAIAYSFGINIFRNPSEVERDILYLLDKNTKAFLDAAVNPANYKVFILRMAEKTGVIALDQNNNTFRWKSNNNVICSFAMGSDAFMEMAKWVQKPENDATYVKIKELWEESKHKGFANYNANGLTPEASGIGTIK